MAEQNDQPETTLKAVTIRITQADLEAWRRIAHRRYPRDNQRMSQVIREVIREEDERGARQEQQEEQ